MDYIYAFLFGSSLKMYDDLNDNNLIDKLGYINELVKGLPWILGTLLAYNDFNYQLLFIIINLASSLGDKEPYSGGYVTAHKILNPLLLLLSADSIKYFKIIDFVYIFFHTLNMFLESLIFKEESSLRKLIVRSVCSINLLLSILFGFYFGVSKSIIKILFLSVGYSLVSVCFQIYFNEVSTCAQYKLHHL
jgi:hypothetical protein